MQIKLIDRGRAFIPGNNTGYWKADTNKTLYPAIARYCRPLKEFDHFTPTLLELYLYEHTRPSFQRMHEFVKSLAPKDGRLKVYEAQSCLKAIEGKWDNPFEGKSVPAHMLN